jgi:pyruvate dehydrogenase phosphatase
LDSNDPSEDDHSEAFVNSGDSRWSFFTVLDGHSGWETSALLREELIDTVITQLADVAPGNSESSDPFAEAITRAFKQLDDKIVHQNVEQALQSNSRSVAINLLAPAYAGACALLAFYDANNSKLRVALTGDCRAVLGRKRRDGRYDLEVLTADQTGFNPEEKKRLEAAHPGEEVVRDGRTMGFGPARAFGDARLKWSRDVQDKLKRAYLGRTVLDSIKTPPYFTAEPVVKATNVQPGDFLVLATDGLWESLTNQEVVGLVGKWAQQHEDQRTPWLNWWWGSKAKAEIDLPVVCNEKATTSEKPTRYQQWHAEKKFVTVDPNAATHLIRNALGGADEDLREALLSMRSPRARVYRFDLKNLPTSACGTDLSMSKGRYYSHSCVLWMT